MKMMHIVIISGFVCLSPCLSSVRGAADIPSPTAGTETFTKTSPERTAAHAPTPPINLAGEDAVSDSTAANPPSSEAVGACDGECDWCWCGTEYENNCPQEWFYDDQCDCGCQWCDGWCACDLQDCGADPCAGCERCWYNTPTQNNCPAALCGDGVCDCYCQWFDQDCGGPPCARVEPDLVVQSSGRTPATDIDPGDMISLSDTVANAGSGGTGAAFWVSWFISLDNIVTTLDFEWAFRASVSLEPDATSGGASPVPWPDQAPYNTPGATYYIALMVDDTNLIAESNENNNWGTAWPVTLADTPGDAYEPDDIPQDATVVNCGDTHAHTVEVDGDVDWSAITLQEGQKLTIETLNLSGTNTDTVLQLYNADCNWIGEDYDGGVGAASRLEWIATYAGIHRIKAFTYGGSFGFCDSQGGGYAMCAYDIRFSCCPPPAAASNPVPPNGATDVPLDVTLCWNTVKRSADDSSGRAGLVEYDVHFGVCGSVPSLATTTGTCWTPPTVDPNKEYCWKVTTRDDCGAVSGPVPWTFETVLFCPDGLVTWEQPPGGVLDARQPHKINDAGAAQGIDTFVVRAPANVDPRCWSLCETLADGLDNDIASVSDNGNGTYTLRLVRRITPGALTRMVYASSVPQTGTFTSLPGDSDGDGVSTVNDIAPMVQCCLSGGCASPSAYRCDINHSGSIDAADLLRVIDLQNGAGEFTRAWQGEVVHDLGECD